MSALVHPGKAWVTLPACLSCWRRGLSDDMRYRGLLSRVEPHELVWEQAVTQTRGGGGFPFESSEGRQHWDS